MATPEPLRPQELKPKPERARPKQPPAELSLFWSSAAMTMILNVPGASPGDIARGPAAAQAVFAKVGVTPMQAAEALLKRDGLATLGFPDGGEPSADEFAAADAFDVAKKLRSWRAARAGLMCPRKHICA
ncbi:hypothetical protein LJR084_007391 [Variovorax sp. LjRoot84]|uniref:hypothetical protein n=1 Tax=Variovorax sp. LjRoot84 TaxID=3342340 RepID=UPI003ECD7364